MADVPAHILKNARGEITEVLVPEVVGGGDTLGSGTTSDYLRGDRTWVTLDKTAVGLFNVDNTSDLNKPVSTAQDAAISAKYTKPGTGIPKTDLASSVQTSLGLADTALQSAPVTAVAGKTGSVSLAKGDVGLSNVDNTSDANKPVSTATQTALDLKADEAVLAFNVKNYGCVGNGTTDDGANLNTCLAAALAAGGEVYWPPGTYKTTINLPNLHAVRHRGPGAVAFSGVNFYVAPTTGQVNTLYVATTGSNSNDGCAARPFLTLQKAFDVLMNYGPTLGGLWTISMAAGTYTGATLSSNLRAEDTVTVKGPAAGHPNVPTVTITNGYNAATYGIRAIVTGVSLTVQDILFSGYNGSTAAAGITVSTSKFELFTVNCHFTDCYYGIATQTTPYNVKGGIFTRCGFLGDTPNNQTPSTRNGTGAACRSLMQSRHSIGLQNAGNNNNGPDFLGCYQGLFAQENSTGHLDWVTIQDCITGVYLSASSRANCDGTSFKRNTADFRVMLDSHAYVTANCTFGTGADESDSHYVCSAGGQVVDDNRFFTDAYPIYGHSIKGLETVFPDQSVNTTGNTVVYTATLAGYMWRDAVSVLHPRKRLHLVIEGELFGTLDTKKVLVRLGTASVSLLFTASETGVFMADAWIYMSDVSEQRLMLRGYRHLGTGTRLSRAVGSNAMTSDTALTVEAAVGNTGDSISIYSIDTTWA